MAADAVKDWIDWTGDAYTEFLKARRDKTFFVYPYGGHSGDVFIRMGTHEMLSDLGVRTTVDPRQADVIHWAGGYLTMWKDNLAALGDLLHRYKAAECIVGPTTFNDMGEDWWPALAPYAGRIAALFARDKGSHAYLKGKGLPTDIYLGLSHDPALYLRNRPLMTAYREAGSADYILVAMRRDHETAMPPASGLGGALMELLPRSVADHWAVARRRSHARHRTKQIAHSLAGGLPVRVKDIPRACYDHFLETVRGASVVHTDRLHAMIVSTMLGKRIVAYDTLDSKLEAVYDHSLKSLPGISITFTRHT
jgi:polysaccharide pyruvyl transferase WcaK-like protein